MLKPAASEILKENQSYYSLVIAVAKRAREIADEMAEKKELNPKNNSMPLKPVDMAVNEFYTGESVIVEAAE